MPQSHPIVDLPPPILWEDESLIAYNKPAGLLVAPDRWDENLPNLAHWVRQQYGPAAAPVHRLDKETSGVILCGKNLSAVQALSEQFSQHKVEKTYWALTSPPPPQYVGTISVPLGPHHTKPGLMAVDRDGKPATTDYQIQTTWAGSWPTGALSLVKLQPRTGRTHQLRVHLAMLRSPIVGDTAYGGLPSLRLADFKRNYQRRCGPDQGLERPIFEQLALYAAELRFLHPQSGEPVEIQAPFPPNWERLLKSLAKYAKEIG